MNDAPITSIVVDIDEAAALQSTGRRTVELLLARGEIPSLLISRRARRIRRTDIDLYVARRLEANADQVQVEPVSPEASALIRKRGRKTPRHKNASPLSDTLASSRRRSLHAGQSARNDRSRS